MCFRVAILPESSSYASNVAKEDVGLEYYWDMGKSMEAVSPQLMIQEIEYNWQKSQYGI